MFDLMHEVKAVESVPPAVRTAVAHADGTTGWVDIAGYESVGVVIHVGDWTDGGFPFILQDSADTGGTKTAATLAAANYEVVGPAGVSALPTVGSETEDDLVYEVNIKNSARFIRVQNGTVTGSPSTGLAWGALVLLGRPRQTPIR
jgi:hypothetical protein